jgi:hypothetical protein
MISERLARGAGACLVLLPFSASVLAQEEIAFWQFTPRASIAQIYSDNIDQAPRGEENSEPVTDLNVGFRLNRDGPRGSGRFDYNLQGVAFWDESDRTKYFNSLPGQATSRWLRSECSSRARWTSASARSIAMVPCPTT